MVIGTPFANESEKIVKMSPFSQFFKPLLSLKDFPRVNLNSSHLSSMLQTLVFCLKNHEPLSGIFSFSSKITIIIFNSFFSPSLLHELEPTLTAIRQLQNRASYDSMTQILPAVNTILK